MGEVLVSWLCVWERDGRAQLLWQCPKHPHRCEFCGPENAMTVVVGSHHHSSESPPHWIESDWLQRYQRAKPASTTPGVTVVLCLFTGCGEIAKWKKDWNKKIHMGHQSVPGTAVGTGNTAVRRKADFYQSTARGKRMCTSPPGVELLHTQPQKELSVLSGSQQACGWFSGFLGLTGIL